MLYILISFICIRIIQVIGILKSKINIRSKNKLKFIYTLKIQTIYENKNEINLNNNNLYDNPFIATSVKRYFFKWNDNSCRLDTTFFLFSFVFYPNCNKIEFGKNSYPYKIYNICENIIDLDNNEYKKGIWVVMNKYNTDLKKFIVINK